MMRFRAAIVHLVLVSMSGLPLLFAPHSLSSQGLSVEEKKIIERTGASVEAALGFLETAVNINSGTLNVEGVRRVGDLFRKELDAIGFVSRWLEMPKEMKRAGHLLSERKGSRGKRLLLIGHLDTVFEPDNPFQKFSRRGDKAYGPGVGDMKGGDVVILYALKALHEAGFLEGTRITVIITGDEEEPGRPISVSRGDLIAAAKNTDIALEFEGSIGLKDATIARRGSSSWVLTVKGKAGHSSRIFTPEYGGGAIFEAARILNAFREEVIGDPYLVVNPGVVLGGTSVEYDAEKATGKSFGMTNVIPENVTVLGGLRFLSEEQHEQARAKMKQVVTRHLPQTSAELKFEDEYPAMAPTAGNKALFQIYDKISRDLGIGPIEPLDPAERGAGDVSFVAPYIDGLAGLGPAGIGAHSAEEEIDLRSFSVSVQRAALLIYRLAR